MWDDDDALIARAEELEDLRRNLVERDRDEDEDPELFDEFTGPCGPDERGE